MRAQNMTLQEVADKLGYAGPASIDKAVILTGCRLGVIAHLGHRGLADVNDRHPGLGAKPLSLGAPHRRPSAQPPLMLAPTATALSTRLIQLSSPRDKSSTFMADIFAGRREPGRIPHTRAHHVGRRGWHEHPASTPRRPRQHDICIRLVQAPEAHRHPSFPQRRPCSTTEPEMKSFSIGQGKGQALVPCPRGGSTFFPPALSGIGTIPGRPSPSSHIAAPPSGAHAACHLNHPCGRAIGLPHGPQRHPSALARASLDTHPIMMYLFLM
jgi:hypothetical protein